MIVVVFVHIVHHSDIVHLMAPLGELVDLIGFILHFDVVFLPLVHHAHDVHTHLLHALHVVGVFLVFHVHHTAAHAATHGPVSFPEASTSFVPIAVLAFLVHAFLPLLVFTIPVHAFAIMLFVSEHLLA